MSQAEDILGKPDLFEERELCCDGSCVGVIGKDGKCTVCGNRGKKKENKSPPQKQLESKGKDSSAKEEDSFVETVEKESVRGEKGFDPKRKLCSDGSCIGVIGPDGRCKECGKVYTGS